MRRHDVSVKIVVIDFKDAENHLLTLKNSTETELRRNYRGAFQDDVPSKDDGFKYLLIYIDGTLEAIARVKFPNSFSSLTRIILKCNALERFYCRNAMIKKYLIFLPIRRTAEVVARPSKTLKYI